MRRTLIAILVCLACGTSSAALAGDVDVTNIATKIVKGRDQSGDVWFAVKGVVKNNDRTEKQAVVTFQAIDSEGFELTSVSVVAKLKPGESKIVSTQSYMPETDYKRAKWRVKD